MIGIVSWFPFRRAVAGRLLIAGLVFGIVAAPAAARDWLKIGGDLVRSLGGETAAQAPVPEDVVAGLKEALQVGTANVVSRLGQADGFNADPKVHIPLPRSLETVRSGLSKIGMGHLTDDLELRLNRAAEAAAPQARDIFLDAIGKMSLEDARRIWKGPADAATRYFEEKMSTPLAAAMRPVIDDQLAQVGAVRLYDQVMGRYRALPFVPDLQADLTGHVVDRGLAGLFHYLAEEEAAIRADPARRTTDLLRRVFGSASGGGN